jgi:hypothetical protein
MTRLYERPAPLRDVLEEHLEEGAFLYHHRRRCFSDGRYSWDDARDRERRLDAHLHALALGGRFSAELLQEKLVLEKDDDPGESFVAASVLPSLGLVEPMTLLTDALVAEPPHVRALIDGLRYASAPAVEPWLGDYIQAEAPVLRAVGVEVLGLHWPAGAEERIAAAARDSDPRVKLVAAGVLASHGKPFDVRPLLPLLDAPDRSISVGTARLLLASGDDFTLDWLRRRLSTSEPATAAEFAKLLAVAGDLNDVPPIRAVLKATSEHAPTLLHALGRSGAVSACDDLLGVVSTADPAAGKTFAAAWHALGTLSGRHLPPPFDLEDDGPEPAHAYADLWRRWWDAARTKMSPALKHRCGRPLSPGALVADLKRPGNTARDLSYLELQVRYRCSLPFEPDSRHATQARQLSALESWSAEADSKHPPGASFFAGKKL